jgi:flagellar basal body P-ring formation protein FlgA
MNHYHRKLSLVIIILMFYSVLPVNLPFTHADSGLAVELVGQARVKMDKDLILLKDLVHIYGDDRQLNQKIGRIEMGKVLPLGQSRIIDEKDIRRSIKRAGIKSEKIEITLSQPISVTRAAMTISPDLIKTSVRNFIINHLAFKKATVTIKEIRWSGPVNLPKGKLSYHIEPKYHSDLIGKISLTIFFDVNGQLEKRLLVFAKVEVVKKVVLARNLISRGQLIQRSDLELCTLELSQIKGQPLTDIESLSGKRAIHHIYPKQVILENDVEIPPVVMRGDTVKIVVNFSNLTATARGVVRENGRIGDKIKVVNIDSKKSLYATVIDHNTVRINL